MFPCQLASQPSKPRLHPSDPPPFLVKLQAGVCPSSLSYCYPEVPLLHPAFSCNIHSENTNAFLDEIILEKKKQKNSDIISLVGSNGISQTHLINITYWPLTLYLCWPSHTGEVRKNKVELDRQPDWDTVHFCPLCVLWNIERTLHFSNIFASK